MLVLLAKSVAESLRRSEDQGQWGPEFMTDVREHLRLELVDLLEPFHRLRELLPLLKDRSLESALLGDVTALHDQEPCLSTRIKHRADAEIDHDRLRAAFAAIDSGVVANELALGGSPDPFLELLLSRLGTLPPAGIPEWLAVDIGTKQSRSRERRVVGLPNIALRITEALKLESVVQRDPGQ